MKSWAAQAPQESAMIMSRCLARDKNPGEGVEMVIPKQPYTMAPWLQWDETLRFVASQALFCHFKVLFGLEVFDVRQFRHR